MLRKLSTRFKSRKDEASGVNGTNGINGTTHGVTNGTNGDSRGKASPKERHNSFTLFKSKKDTSDPSTDHSASRQDVEDSFEQFAQVIHASVRIHSYLFFERTAIESQGIFRKRQSPFRLSIYRLEREKLIPQSYAAATVTHTGW